MQKRTITQKEVHAALSATVSRGPDGERIEEVGKGWMGFQRLAIMGLTDAGMQPFFRNSNAVVCNGEIYGFRQIRTDLIAKGHRFMSLSDCEILLPMYAEYGTDMFAMLERRVRAGAL